MTFWKGWESWEKIVFILACAMVWIRPNSLSAKKLPTNREQVAVIIVGSLVASVNRWKLRLHNKAHDEEAREPHKTWRQHDLGDVPFGARALESGIQVDGVYSPRQYAPRHNSITHRGVSQSSASSVPPSPLTPTISRSSQQHCGPFSPV